MQKYRFDGEYQQNDGALVQQSYWMGGPTLAGIKNCRWENLEGEPRVTAYVTGEANTYFSVPAVCCYKGRRVRGYITADSDGNMCFRHCYY